MNRRQKMIETLSSLLSSKKNRYKRDPPNVVASMLRGKFRGIGYWLPKLVETNDLVPPPPPSGVQHPYLHDISCNNGSALPQIVLSPGEREERNDASTRNVNESFSEREGGATCYSDRGTRWWLRSLRWRIEIIEPKRRISNNSWQKEACQGLIGNWYMISEKTLTLSVNVNRY